MECKVFSILFLLFCVVQCQENSRSNIASGLIHCYNESMYNHQIFRLPSSMNALIDLIRRVEDGKSAQDARNFAIELIHRFRQDGIRKVNTSNIVSIPYSAKGFQKEKNSLLLQKFIPGSAVNFPNETLTPIEQCSLHFMLSNTFVLDSRGTENNECSKIGQYRNRIPRQAEDTPDIEILPRSAPKGFSSSNEISQCPIEEGVVYTKYGEIQAGTVIASIAAALEKQVITEHGFQVDSIFASTLSGDLTEIALIQGTSKSTFEVGLRGQFNSTTAPHTYFVEYTRGYEMTDSEIRASLDGLIIANNIREWNNKFANIKISQILDMYYSPRGVFGNTEHRACNRNNLATKYAPEDLLKKQTMGFAHLYNSLGTFDGTITPDAIGVLVNSSTSNYFKYLSSLHDVGCEGEEVRDRIATHVILLVDLQWPFKTIHQAISYFLDNIDVNKYESRYTLINAANGDKLVNTSESLLEFHKYFNERNVTAATKGFKLTESVPTLETVLEEQLDFEREHSIIGGNSSIVLFLPHTTTIDSNDASYFESKKSTVFHTYHPDVTFMVLGAGSKDAYKSLTDNTEDIFTLNQNAEERDIISAVDPLIKKVSQVYRRIINPKCDNRMQGESSGNSMDFFVEPGTTNYYKISPNYLVGEGNKHVQIRGTSGSLTVCQPAGQACQVNNDITFDISELCTNDISTCSPYTFSISGPNTTTSVNCKDTGCRFPDNIKFSIQVEGLTCLPGGASQIIASIFLLFSSLYLICIV